MIDAPLHSAWLCAAAVPLAWAFDQVAGEPPNALHPVAWLGRLMTPVGLRMRQCSPRVALIAGTAVWSACAVVLGLSAGWLEAMLLQAPAAVAVLMLAAAFKPMFAWRMLRDEVVAVEQAQQRGGLAASRDRLSRLVSRDVRSLDEAGVRETAIETLAENLNDSVVAPLFWFALFGLPGAVVYRFANTADAMWGYRDAWEWAGKFSARADDLLSWVPARLTALLLWPGGASTPRLRREARRTPSPNGGWPMGAMALWLNVSLGKPGVYRLNADAPPPLSADVSRAVTRAGHAAAAAMVWATLVWAGRAAWG